MTPAPSRDQNRSDPAPGARGRQLKALLVQLLQQVVDPGEVLVDADVTGLLSDQTARSTARFQDPDGAGGKSSDSTDGKEKSRKSLEFKMEKTFPFI